MTELLTKSSESKSSSDEDEAENFADEDSDTEEDTKTVKSSGLSTDSEISRKDMWYCTQCNVATNKPYLRYCLRCFRVSFRLSFFGFQLIHISIHLES